ncbi:MAG: hypothetical protein ABR613_05950 [Actinomycetota bacterium]
MSFFMEVRGIDVDAEEAQHLSGASTDNGGYPFHAKPSLFRKRINKLYIADWKLGEGLLADDADWDAPTWSMRPEELPRLEATLKTLCDALPQGFEFVASWVSEPLDRRVEVSCDELLQLAQASSFNGNTLYVVKSAEHR